MSKSSSEVSDYVNNSGNGRDTWLDPVPQLAVGTPMTC